jgi:hypothetical protein
VLRGTSPDDDGPTLVRQSEIRELAPNVAVAARPLYPTASEERLSALVEAFDDVLAKRRTAPPPLVLVEAAPPAPTPSAAPAPAEAPKAAPALAHASVSALLLALAHASARALPPALALALTRVRKKLPPLSKVALAFARVEHRFSQRGLRFHIGFVVACAALSSLVTALLVR